MQLAKAFGAEVTGVCSTTKVDLVRSIGADHVIDYTRDDFADGEQRYDLILDIGGQLVAVTPAARARPRRGRSSSSGGEGGGRWLGGIDRQLRAHAAVAVRGPEAGHVRRTENHEDLLVLKELIEAGKVTPVIDRTYPLSEVPDAIRYLEDGHARGKVVITV